MAVHAAAQRVCETKARACPHPAEAVASTAPTAISTAIGMTPSTVGAGWIGPVIVGDGVTRGGGPRQNRRTSVERGVSKGLVAFDPVRNAV